MAALRRSEPVTVEDLAAMPDDGHRYELWEGTLIVTPAPGFRHQTCVVRLSAQLLAAASPEHAVLVAPFDWVLGPRTLFQPDLLVARRSEIGEARLERAPLLAVEVLSPSTRGVDATLKRLAYAEAGVADYWLVDPLDPKLTALHLQGDTYEEAAVVVGDQEWTARSPFEMTLVPSVLVR